MQILFTLAMDYEIENIFDLRDWTLAQESPYKVYASKKNKNIGIIKTGIGKVNAAAAAQYALLKFTPQRVINLGAVGCLNKNINIGEVRKISGCRFFDVDVRMFDYALGQIPQCDLTEYTLLSKNENALSSAKIITGDTFISDVSKLTEISEIFLPDFVDMEVTAIAHVLYVNSLLQILESYKAPSDFANGTATKDFYANEKIAFKNLKILANKIIEEQLQK